MLERAGELSPKLFPPANAGHPLVWGCIGVQGAGWWGEVHLVALSIDLRAGRSGCCSQLCPFPVMVPSCAVIAASLKHDMSRLGQVLAPLVKLVELFSGKVLVDVK